MARRITVDLRAVSFIDSTGLQVLLFADEASGEEGWTWTILASDAVMRVAQLVGLDGRLPIDDRP